jgi:hypothetical protein
MGLAPGLRRLALALVEEAAIQGGGRRHTQGGAEWLIGCAPGPARRAAHSLGILLEAAPERFLPNAGPHTADTPMPPPPEALSAIEAWVAAQPLATVTRLSIFQAAGAPAAQRLAPLPPAGAPAQLRDALCRRVVAALASREALVQLPRLRPGLRLMLDLPLEGLPGGLVGAGGAGGAIALLPLAAAADMAALERSFDRLRYAGWSPALLIPDGAALGLIDLSGLPADLLLIENPSELPVSPPAPLALAGRIDAAARARAAAAAWLVEAP